MSLMQKTYDSIPVSLQEYALSAWGLYWKWLRLGGDFGSELTGWKERESWQSGRLADHQALKLRELLALALESSEHYPAHWKDHGLTADQVLGIDPSTLEQLPVTSRNQFKNRPWSVYNGGQSGQRFSIKRATSGTTGTPLTVAFSPQVYQSAYAAVEARGYNWAGVSVSGRRTTIGARSIVPARQSGPPFWRRNYVESQLYLSAFHLSPHSAGGYCTALNDFAPEMMTGFSSSHYLLASMIESQDLRVHAPVAVVPGSDSCEPHMKDKIESVFGAPVYPLYGMVEQCLLATTCEQGSLHVHPDFGIVEIVDNSGRALPPGETGRIVATGLVNTSSLFIRYDTGDIGSWSGKRCPCGRDNMPVLESLEGRVEDVVRTPEGRELTRLDRLFTNLAGIECAQVVQSEPDTLVIRLMVSAEADRKAMEREMQSRAVSFVGRMNLEFEYVKNIPRDPNGKFRAVISQLADRAENQRSREL
jgi:phenylacetate-CoA ligase